MLRIIFLLLLFSFVIGCGPTQEMIEYEQEKRTADSLDSVSVVIEKFRVDSIHKADSISKLPCTDLEEYVRLNERLFTVIKNADGDPEKVMLKKFDRVSDSISKEEKNIVTHKMATMEQRCQNRFFALTIYYTKEMANTATESTIYEKLFSHDKLDKAADSLIDHFNHKQ